MQNTIKVFYTDKMVAQSGSSISPSAEKPAKVHEMLLASPELPVEIVSDFPPLTIDDIKRCHDAKYVDDIWQLKRKNGFGTLSQDIIDSLPYTHGAMYAGAKAATPTSPSCALVSGFHHAGYDNWEKLGWFCTFNGLLTSAYKLIDEDNKKSILIVDCDAHWGNGTDHILARQPERKEFISHISFGKTYRKRTDNYLDGFWQVERMIERKKPDVILFQSGADCHIDDPIGDGILTEEEMYYRDLKMFRLAKQYEAPICWNLAGGYQRDPDGGISMVLRLHKNTFKACKEIFFSNGT